MIQIRPTAAFLARTCLAAAIALVALGSGGCGDSEVPNQAAAPDPKSAPPYAQQDPRGNGAAAPATNAPANPPANPPAARRRE